MRGIYRGRGGEWREGGREGGREREGRREGGREREPTFLWGWLSNCDKEMPHFPADIFCRQQPPAFLTLKELESNLHV